MSLLADSQLTNGSSYFVAVGEVRPLFPRAADTSTTGSTASQCLAAGDDSECRVALLQRYNAFFLLLATNGPIYCPSTVKSFAFFSKTARQR